MASVILKLNGKFYSKPNVHVKNASDAKSFDVTTANYVNYINNYKYEITTIANEV